MFVGVEQFTDRRFPATIIERFRDERSAREWLAQANPDPPYSDSFHRRVRVVYVMKHGFRVHKHELDKLPGIPEATARAEVYAANALKTITAPPSSSAAAARLS